MNLNENHIKKINPNIYVLLRYDFIYRFIVLADVQTGFLVLLTNPHGYDEVSDFKYEISVAFDLEVTVAMGDGESYTLATELMKKLKEYGYNVSGINQAIYKPDLPKQNFVLTKPADYKIAIDILPLSYINN